MMRAVEMRLENSAVLIGDAGQWLPRLTIADTRRAA